MEDTVAALIKCLETLLPLTKIEVVTCNSSCGVGMMELLDIEVNTTYIKGADILELGIK
jgi:hypothetical protein